MVTFISRDSSIFYKLAAKTLPICSSFISDALTDGRRKPSYKHTTGARMIRQEQRTLIVIRVFLEKGIGTLHPRVFYLLPSLCFIMYDRE
jgi:hypothetical protein